MSKSRSVLLLMMFNAIALIFIFFGGVKTEDLDAAITQLKEALLK